MHEYGDVLVNNAHVFKKISKFISDKGWESLSLFYRQHLESCLEVGAGSLKNRGAGGRLSRTR